MGLLTPFQGNKIYHCDFRSRWGEVLTPNTLSFPQFLKRESTYILSPGLLLEFTPHLIRGRNGLM